MRACLIQWPELVTCPSAQCKGEREGVGAGMVGLEGHAHCYSGTRGLGNFPPTGGLCTPDVKKTRQRAPKLVQRGRRRPPAFTATHIKRNIPARINAHM